MQDSSAVAPQMSISSIWMDKRWRGVILQIITIAILGAVIAYLITNLFENAAAQGLELTFNFLFEPSHYDINQHLIDYNSTMTHGRAALVGILNTALVAFCGIILTTIVGFTGGVLSLSRNWLVSRTVYCYVEFCRNVPVLVQILLWYAVILKLPREALTLGDSIFLSNRGFYLPKPLFEPGMWAVFIALIAGIAHIADIAGIPPIIAIAFELSLLPFPLLPFSLLPLLPDTAQIQIGLSLPLCSLLQSFCFGAANFL